MLLAPMEDCFAKTIMAGFKKKKLEYFEGEECYNIKFDE